MLNRNGKPGQVGILDFRGPFSLGILVTLAGAYFDAWWHIFQGREAFWTPAHIVLYSGVGIMLLSTVLASIRILSFPGLKLGAWARAALFSGLGTMLVSAPIDDWWHTAFGPDTGAWTPPHLLAMAGFSVLLATCIVAFYSESGRLVKALLASSAGLFATLIVTVTLVA